MCTPLTTPPWRIQSQLYLHPRTHKYCCRRTFTYTNVQHFFSATPEPQPFIFTAMAKGLMALPSCAPQTGGHIPVDDSYLFYPKFDLRGQQPYHFDTITYYQKNDSALQLLPTTNPKCYFPQLLDKHSIDCRCNTLDPSSSWKILLPNNMLEPLIQWYHDITVHSTGIDRLEAIIRRHFYHPNLRHVCQKIVSNCTICQQVWTSSHETGQLAPRKTPIFPWHEVHIDFIGPWHVVTV